MLYECAFRNRELFAIVARALQHDARRAVRACNLQGQRARDNRRHGGAYAAVLLHCDRSAARHQVRQGAFFGSDHQGSVPALAWRPTVEEVIGVRGDETSVMYGVWAPAKTPDEVVGRLNAEIVKLLRDPVFSQKREEKGLDSVTPGTVGEIAGYLKARLPKWGKMVQESGRGGTK